MHELYCDETKYNKNNRETGANADWLLLVNCIDLDRLALNFNCKFTCLSKAMMRGVATPCVYCVGFCLGHLPSQNCLFLFHLGFSINIYAGLFSISICTAYQMIRRNLPRSPYLKKSSLSGSVSAQFARDPVSIGSGNGRSTASFTYTSTLPIREYMHHFFFISCSTYDTPKNEM